MSAKRVLTRRIVSSPWRDDRGALMVAGIFMMLIVVALLYVLIGTALTLRAREGMQDAADASAFAAAVFMARGMNLIALINLLMALLISILVAIRLFQTFFIMGAAALYSCSWYFGITAGPAAAFNSLAGQMNNIYNQAKDPIFEALEVMHNVQEGVSVVIPFVAVGAGALEAAQHHPPAQGAFTLPAPAALPVESDEFKVLCGRASTMVMTGAFRLFAEGADLPEQLADIAFAPIEKAAGAIGEATSAYLCGDGSGSPPTHSYQVDQGYPKTDESTSCEEDPEGAECLEEQQRYEQARPDERGECRTDCSFNDLYEKIARRARVDCEPRSRFQPKKFTWQKVNVDSVWIYQDQGWVEQSRSLYGHELIEDSYYPPCGREGTLNDQLWNLNSGGPSQPEPSFLCDDREPLTEVGALGERRSITYTAALRLFSCTVEETKTVELAESSDTFGGEGEDDKSPHRMQEDATLGSETFQVRALAFGPEVGPSYALDGVRVALLGRTPPSTSSFAMDLSSVINRFSFAQAEYFFDHDGSTPPSEWLWEMRWKARLVRVRLPSQEEEQDEQQRQEDQNQQTQAKVNEFGGNVLATTLDSACSAVTDQCPDQKQVENLSSWVIH